MRRFLSISLILLFGFGPLAATLGASEDAGLPACCRRQGSHHCAESMRSMEAAIDAAPGKAILAPRATCPGFPGSAAPTRSAQAMTASLVSLPDFPAQSHTKQVSDDSERLSQIRTRAGRGPPSSALA